MCLTGSSNEAGIFAQVEAERMDPINIVSHRYVTMN